MVDPISNVRRREIGLGSNRLLASAAPAVKSEPPTDLASDLRVEVLQAAVGKLIRRILPGNSRLKIERNKETGAFIYRSFDPETGELLKEWPSEELLELREHLKEMEGLLVDKQV